jgi:predicted SprT family Zn-dependent metalloprotease
MKSKTNLSLSSVEKLANELMSKHFKLTDIYGNNHNYSVKELGYIFKWDTAKTRNGKINYNKKIISLSKLRVEANIDKIDTVIKNTILHEIAHAFSFKIYGRDGLGHGSRWKITATQIGCNGQRCTSGYESVKESKYTLLCNTCGREIKKHRKPKFKMSCGKCSPKVYNEKYMLKVIQNF